jgi:carbon starvation protein
LILAIIGGGWISEASGYAGAWTFTPVQLVFALIVYGFVASVLPVWMLLAPRDYLSTFMKIGTVILLAVGIAIVLPTLQMPATTQFTFSGTGPVFYGPLWPFVFIIIACGALSGFHSLIASGTTPKLIQKESQVRIIGYGGMLMESFVAVMAMIAATVLDPGVYFAMNAPSAVVGSTVESASQAVSDLGFAVSAETLSQTAEEVGESTIVARTGGAPTLAVGMAEIFSGFLGGAALKAFWYHFAIMFEALFILTTVDAGTRVGRFLLQDLAGNVWRPAGRTSWWPGVIVSSALIVAAWGYFLYQGATDPLGGIFQLFPLFGIANQLLAAVALAVATTIIIKMGKLKYAWVTLIPLAFDAANTLKASYHKIFSADPKLGFFSQASQFREAYNNGETIAPTTSLDQMWSVVQNSTINGIATIIFALAIIVVLLDSARVWYGLIWGKKEPELHEAPYEPSEIETPPGTVTAAMSSDRNA